MKLKTGRAALTILILIVINLNLSFSQSIKKIDSLKTVLLELENSEKKADILISISELYKMNNPDKCLAYARQAYDLSIETAYNKGQAKALIMMGIVNKHNSDYNLAFQYAEKADSIAFVNNFVEEKIAAIELKGKLYRLIGDPDKGLEYLFICLKLSEELGDKQRIGSAFNNIGYLNYDQKNYEKALEYYMKAMSNFKDVNYREGIASCLNNFAATYAAMGEIDNFENYVREAIDINRETNNKTWLIINYLNLGALHSYQDNMDSAIYYSEIAYALAEEIHNLDKMAAIKLNLGKAYYHKTGDVNYSLEFAYEALAIAKSKNIKKEIYNSAGFLKDLYKSINNSDSAYKYMNLKFMMKDSLDIEKNDATIAKLELQHFVEKLRLEQESSKKQNRLRFLIVSITLLSGIVILLSLLIFVYIRYRLNRKQQKIIAAQNEEIASTVEELKVAQSILKNIPGVTYRCLLDKDWTMLFISDEIEQLSGYPAREFLGDDAKRSFASIMHEDDLEPIARNTSSAMEDRRPYTNEYRIIDKDGMVHWVYAKGQTIYDDLGQPLYLDGNIFDITDKKTAELELASMKQNLEKLVAERTRELTEANKEIKTEMKDRIRAQKEIFKSEEKFRGVFNSMTDVFTRSDMNGKCLMISPSIYNILGYKPEEILGKNFADFYADPIQRIEIVNQLQKTKTVENFEIDVVRKDGKTITISTNAKIYYNSKGEPLGVESNIRDITQKKKLEEDRYQSEQRYQALSEASFEAIFISEKGVCIEQNLRAEEMFGYTLSEAVGRKGTEWIIPEDREMVMNKMLSGYDAKPYETTALRKDGSTFPAEIQAKMMYFKGRDVRVTALKDITARKQAEDALRESEEKFRTLVTKTEEIIYIIAKDGTFLLSEGKGLAKLGLKPGEVVGMSVFDLYKNSPLMLDKMRQAFNGETVIMEHAVGDIYFKSWYTPYLNQKGEIIGLLGLAVNITEQKEAEIKILENQEKLKALTNELIISEEKQRREIANDLHDHVGQILASSRLQIAAIKDTMGIKDVLKKLNTISSGLYEAIGSTRNAIFELSPPQLNEIGLAAALSDWMHNEMTKYDIKYELTGDVRKLPINKELRYLIFRCICELLLNVIKHAGATKVIVSFEKKKNSIFISVHDNGSGFNYNPDLPRTKDTGFGLFSINERIESIDGELLIDTTLGKGTNATLRVPIKKVNI